jgi:hypothetical protein
LTKIMNRIVESPSDWEPGFRRPDLGSTVTSNGRQRNRHGEQTVPDPGIATYCPAGRTARPKQW